MMGADRAVLWDLDGTLVDSRDQHWRAWRSAMAAEGVTITEPQFLASFGQRNDAILTGWLGARATPDFIARVGEEKERRFRELVEREGATLLPGVAHWVQALAAAGWVQAIASSAPRLNVEVSYRALGMGDRFGAVVSAEDVRQGKPDPEVFLVAATRVGVPPGRCVVVEDAAAGIEAARRAGMQSIGVGDGVGHAAAITVSSLDRLPIDAFDGLIRGL
ncbi:MAG: HAD family phosphatase [Candidatus Palauibacterales bacterium]|nr:HAD family phosphatase [Candidatus Palauibacterales bacterium]